jgi:hypothetical protein
MGNLLIDLLVLMETRSWRSCDNTGTIRMATSGQRSISLTLPCHQLTSSVHRYPYGSSQQSNTVQLIHDAFQPLSYWNGFETPPNFQGVAMDTHQYQMFSNIVSPYCRTSFSSIQRSRLQGVAQSEQQHIQTACS